jgi:flagellin FlaB
VPNGYQRSVRSKKRKRGLAGLDTAIIMIAFIITASVLAYVAINMGLFVTQKAKTTIDQGEKTASTALTLSGAVLYAVNYPQNTKSYWIYFPVSPSAGVSSVDMSPQTTAISFIASTEGISLSNIYNASLLGITNPSALKYANVSVAPSGQTYYSYSSPYAALLALNATKALNKIFIVETSNTAPTGFSTANEFSFSYGGTTYYAFVKSTFAFTYPIAGDPLVGSNIAPAGSTVGVMILFGSDIGSHVFQYETITMQITPNVGSPLTISQYIYQPSGNVSVIG